MFPRAICPAAVVLALALGVSPVFAQHTQRDRNSGQDRQSGGGGEQKATERSGGERRAPEARPEQRRETPPPPPAPAPAPQRPSPGPERAVERRQPDRREPPTVQERAVPRPDVNRNVDRDRFDRDRNERDRQDRDRFDRDRGTNRGRYVAPRGYYSHGRFISPRTVIVVPARRFYRPYYAFRPRFTLGYGLFVGYPVAYPYYYPDPYYSYPPSYPSYGYSDPYGYSNPAPGTAAISPSMAAGGLSFDIRPLSAEIFVDGEFVGEAGDFTAGTQPLTLYAGRHHIEIRANGYIPMAFDVDVVAGQVIPYQGALQPYRPY